MNTKRVDVIFWAVMSMAVTGTVGGWMSLYREAERAWPAHDEPIPEIAPLAEAIDGWESQGHNTEGAEFLMRPASDGSVERLVVMPDGVGLYTRCQQPDPYPRTDGCVKIILRPKPESQP